MATISWDTIESECGDYKERLVATFRKYEGMDTDERTAQGHVVKVTMASFARHAGIDKAVFYRWVVGCKRQLSAERRTQLEAAMTERDLAEIEAHANLEYSAAENQYGDFENACYVDPQGGIPPLKRTLRDADHWLAAYYAAPAPHHMDLIEKWLNAQLRKVSQARREMRRDHTPS